MCQARPVSEAAENYLIQGLNENQIHPTPKSRFCTEGFYILPGQGFGRGTEDSLNCSKGTSAGSDLQRTSCPFFDVLQGHWIVHGVLYPNCVTLQAGVAFCFSWDRAYSFLAACSVASYVSIMKGTVPYANSEIEWFPVQIYRDGSQFEIITEVCCRPLW